MHYRSFLLLGILGAMLFIIAAYITFFTEKPANHSARLHTELPKYLREASGLARVDESHLLIHNDEKGHVYIIHLPDLGISRLASLGKPVITEDFEGIAVGGDTIYLITSTGMLFVIDEVSFETSDQIVQATTVDTGLTEVCEVEGLHFDRGTLLIPCKNLYTGNEKNAIKVFAYVPGSTSATPLFSLEDPSLKGNRRRVTAIESDASSYYLLTQADLLRVSRDDLSLEFFPLNPTLHRQPEGLAIMDDGSIYLVDDRSKGRGSLTQYTNLAALSEGR